MRMKIKLLKILPFAAGERLKAKLDIVTDAHKKAKDEFDKKWSASVMRALTGADEDEE